MGSEEGSTQSGPVKSQGVFAPTVTIFEQVSVQPLAAVKLRLSVNEPGAVELTVTVCALAGPLMVPLPVMVQV